MRNCSKKVVSENTKWSEKLAKERKQTKMTEKWSVPCGTIKVNIGFFVV